MREIRAEEGNLSALLRAALVDHDVVAILPLIGLLSRFWMIEGNHLTLLALAKPVLDLVLACDDDLPPDELREALAITTLNEAIFTDRARPDAVERLRELGPGGRRSAIAHLLVEVYGSGPALDVARLETLTEHPDPFVRQSALQWASQVLENSGDIRGALAVGRRALALCDEMPDIGPWTRAMCQAQLAGHASQVGDWDLCVEMATAAQATMEELGAADDSLQLRSVLALADLSQGRLDRARAAFQAIAADERGDGTFGWSVGVVGQAELALAEGDIDRGLELYRRVIDVARQHRIDLLELSDLGPWNLYAESSALFAYVASGRRDEAVDLADTLRGKLSAVFTGTATRVDYPVTGCVLLALGAWDLSGRPRDLTPGLTALALASRFGYQRILPTMAWSNVERLASEWAPGLLAGWVASFDDRLPAQLHEEAVQSVGAQTSLR